MKIPTKNIAKAIRVEYAADTDTVYLVFEIIDEEFKQQIKKDWTQDINTKLNGKYLVYDL